MIVMLGGLEFRERKRKLEDRMIPSDVSRMKIGACQQQFSGIAKGQRGQMPLVPCLEGAILHSQRQTSGGQKPVF